MALNYSGCNESYPVFWSFKTAVALLLVYFLNRFAYETIEQTDCGRVEFIFDGLNRYGGRNRFRSFNDSCEYGRYAFGSSSAATSASAAESFSIRQVQGRKKARCSVQRWFLRYQRRTESQKSLQGTWRSGISPLTKTLKTSGKIV